MPSRKTPSSKLIQKNEYIYIVSQGIPNSYIAFTEVIDTQNNGSFMCSFWIKDPGQGGIIVRLRNTSILGDSVFEVELEPDTPAGNFTLQTRVRINGTLQDMVPVNFVVETDKWYHCTLFLNAHLTSELYSVRVNNIGYVDDTTFSGANTFPTTNVIECFGDFGSAATKSAHLTVYSNFEVANQSAFFTGFDSKVGFYFKNFGFNAASTYPILMLNATPLGGTKILNSFTAQEAIVVSANLEVRTDEEISYAD